MFMESLDIPGIVEAGETIGGKKKPRHNSLNLLSKKIGLELVVSK